MNDALMPPKICEVLRHLISDFIKFWCYTPNGRNMRDHINRFASDISTHSCEESPRSLQSKRPQITLDCSVQWSLQSVNLITEVSDWFCVCVCVCVGLSVRTRLKAGTNPPNKHVSSQLLIWPSRKSRQPTLQMFLLHRKNLLQAGNGERCVVVYLPCLFFCVFPHLGSFKYMHSILFYSAVMQMSRSFAATPPALVATPANHTPLPLSPLAPSLLQCVAQSRIFPNQQVRD